MTHRMSMFVRIIHTLHEEQEVEYVIRQCRAWLDHFKAELPPLCSIDLSSTAIH